MVVTGERCNGCASPGRCNIAVPFRITNSLLQISPGDSVVFFIDSTAANWCGCPDEVSKLAFNAGTVHTVESVNGDLFSTTDYSTLWAPISALQLPAKEEAWCTQHATHIAAITAYHHLDHAFKRACVRIFSCSPSYVFAITYRNVCAHSIPAP